MPTVGGKPLTLTSDMLLPDDSRLVFSVRAGGDRRLTIKDAIEVGATNDERKIRLTVAHGVRLESPQTMVATLDPEAMVPPCQR